MHLEEARNLTEGLDPKTLKAIDFKIEHDMEKVLNRMDISNAETKAEMRVLEASIHSLERTIKMILWVVGIAFAVLAILYGLK